MEHAEGPGPGLGETQRRLLEAFKRRGALTLRESGAGLGLSAGTLREHVKSLSAQGLVERSGTRRGGRGRPEVVYRLTAAAARLFPQREAQLLVELVRYLLEGGQDRVLARFFEQRVAQRRDAARARLAGLRGRRRAEEVARLLSEEGFMAEVQAGGAGRPPVLALCHCPLRETVNTTKLPCRAELAFIESLLEAPLRRTRYMPDGDHSCSYQMGMSRGKRGLG